MSVSLSPQVSYHGSVFSPEIAGIPAKKAMISTDKILMPLNSDTAFHERENPIR